MTRGAAEYLLHLENASCLQAQARLQKVTRSVLPNQVPLKSSETELLACILLIPLMRCHGKAVQAHEVVVVHLDEVVYVKVVLHQAPQRHRLVGQRVVLVLCTQKPKLSISSAIALQCMRCQ